MPMNEETEKFYKNQESIARALEIAITLTKADETWIRVDSNGNVIMDEPLFSTVRTVARILMDTNLIAAGGQPVVISGVSRRPDKI